MSRFVAFFVLVLGFCLFLPVSWAADQHSVNGVVNGVKLSAGKLTIAHGPIAELGMEAMTMDFQVFDPAMLEEASKGHAVALVLEKAADGNLVIMEIEDLGLATNTPASDGHEHSHQH